MRRLASLAAAGCAVVALGAAAGQAATGHASTVSKTVGCLQRHHVLAEYKPGANATYGLTTGKWISWVFTGIPQGAIGSGWLVIEPNQARAKMEAQHLYQLLYAYDRKHSNSPPAYFPRPRATPSPCVSPRRRRGNTGKPSFRRAC